jgi:hypothetical protein
MKFDKRIKDILNENILGSIASNVASGIGAGIEAAESPAKGFSRIAQTLSNKSKEAEEKKGQPISNDNKPKEGQIVVYQNNKEYTGKVVKVTEGSKQTVITSDGKFGITLMKPDGQLSEFEFVKTQKKPYWYIENVNVVTNNHINNKDLILKENGILQVSPTVEIPFVLVGKGTKYENWIDYNAYLKNENKK